MKIYTDMKTNEKIDEDEAFDYAMNKIILAFTENNDKRLIQEFEESFKEQLVDWFFSGNYIAEEVSFENYIGGNF